jgi:hypothetical protein
MTYRSGSTLPSLPGTMLPHSNELFRVYEQTPGYAPVLIVASLEDRPVAKLLAVIRRSVRLFPPSFIHRCEVYGTGEYFEESLSSDEIFGQMLEHLTNEVLKDCFLIEFRNLPTALSGYRHFRHNDYFPINWIRVYNSLHNRPPEQRIDSKRLRQVNRSVKLGAYTQPAKTEEDLEAFLRMLQRNYSSKLRKHFPDRQLFRLLIQHRLEGELANVFLVKYKDKVIGGSFCVFSGDRAYLGFSGGLRKSYAWLHPGTMAVWAAICYAHQQGYSHFEFADAGLPFQKLGFRRFLLSFGGKQVSTRRWFRFRWKWLNRLGTLFYR